MLFELFKRFMNYISPIKKIENVNHIIYDSIKNDIYPYKILFDESYSDPKKITKSKKKVVFNYLNFFCLRILMASPSPCFLKLKKDFKLYLMNFYSKEFRLFKDEDFIDQYEFVKQLFTFWNIHSYDGIKNKSAYNYDKLYDKFENICFPSVIIGETEFVYSPVLFGRLNNDDYMITSGSIQRYRYGGEELYAKKMYKEKINMFKNNKHYKKKGSPFNCYVHEKTFLEPIIKLLKEHNTDGVKVMLNYKYELE